MEIHSLPFLGFGMGQGIMCMFSGSLTHTKKSRRPGTDLCDCTLCLYLLKPQFPFIHTRRVELKPIHKAGYSDTTQSEVIGGLAPLYLPQRLLRCIQGPQGPPHPFLARLHSCCLLDCLCSSKDKASMAVSFLSYCSIPHFVLPHTAWGSENTRFLSVCISPLQTCILGPLFQVQETKSCLARVARPQAG